MNREEFQKSFTKLEIAFGEQNAQRRAFFFKELQAIEAWLFERAVDFIIKNRQGFEFPTINEIKTTVDQLQLERSEAYLTDLESREFCQQCENSGFFLRRNKAHFCSCRRGRFKLAIYKLGFSATRSEIENYISTKLPPPSLPITGILEKNPLGFWELNQAEHERWIQAKKLELEEMRLKRQKEEKPMLENNLIKSLLKNTIKEFKEAQVNRESENDDDVPF